MVVELMKECEVFNKGFCSGCTGLAELDWCGPEQCERYRRLNNISGHELCKKIIEGIQIKIKNEV